MPIPSSSAASDSSKISSMPAAYRPRPLPRAVIALATAAAAWFGGCSTPPPRTAEPVPPSPPASAAAAPALPGVPDGPALLRPASRWVPAAFSDLPGWDGERVLEAWSALKRSCERAAPGWERACADAARRAPADEASARAWMMLNLGVYRIESLGGSAEGMITGYFEPMVDASRVPSGIYQVPLYMPPADLATRQPWWTRQQADTQPDARAALRGRELAYVADPMDALLLQIQGSGRLRIAEPDGRQRLVRLAYAGHNGQPYASVGRWLIERGELRADAASWPAIRDWARRNPRRVKEMLQANPRLVFFREEPLLDPESGPKGAQGVPLTPGRSIAVDPQSIPYGTMVWLDTTEPLSATPLQRLVVAQDTGSAITGAVRADFFWGWAGDAEAQAGRMKQPLRMWALWPKS